MCRGPRTSEPAPLNLAQGIEDAWQPTAPLATVRARAQMLKRARAFFDARGLLEVETPQLSRAAPPDPALAPMSTRWSGGASPGRQRLYLHSSPELAMKRLLAAGAGPIYQVCKVFRDGERGRWHHPEFSLLEWYRPGWDLAALIDEVGALVRVLLDRPELAQEQLDYRALFQDRLGVDPWVADASALADVASGCGLTAAADMGLDVDGWLDLLMTHQLQPGLGRDRMTFVRDFPPSQAALARVTPGSPAKAARFELFLSGVELANGFDELTDAAEQRARFAADRSRRAALGLPQPPMDEAFLSALEAGMPATSGVALGLDRLLMLAVGADRIDEVLSFTVERA